MFKRFHLARYDNRPCPRAATGPPPGAAPRATFHSGNHRAASRAILWGRVTLLTAHKILISTAVVFFLFYAGWEARQALAGSAAAAWRAIASVAGALALAVYLAGVWRKRP